MAAGVVKCLYPVLSTVPPTVAQALNYSKMVFSVSYVDDADTVAILTHNWNIAQPTPGGVLTTVFPIVLFGGYDTSTAGTVAAVNFKVVIASSVAVTITKGTVTGTNGTTLWTLLKPEPVDAPI